MPPKTEQPFPVPDQVSAVAFRDVAVRVAGKTIWSGLSGDVEAGTFVAVLGPNGAGKSTLLKAILGLLSLDAGHITVFGKSRTQMRKEEIGYVPQRRHFDASLRVRGVDIVRLGLDGTKLGMPLPHFFASERARRARVDEVIDLVGAGEYATRAIGETSGGEQQRLLIAQALVRQPKLLLLDEPLDSLDLANQHALALLIKNISLELGVAVMMVAHDVNPIFGYLDRVMYVAGGNILMGDPEIVITSEQLSALYGTPIEVLKTADGRVVVVGGTETVSFHGPH